MEYTVMITGFGGQGVLMMGDLLAHSGMESGFNVTWMPSYGVEMRGGAANCTVVISGEEIGAPIVGRPRAVIAMSAPALERFRHRVAPRGLLMVNSSLAPGCPPPEEEVETVLVPTLDLARESGDEKMANLVMLGAFLGYTGVLDLEKQVISSLGTFLPASKVHLAEGMGRALLQGGRFGSSRRGETPGQP